MEGRRSRPSRASLAGAGVAAIACLLGASPIASAASTGRSGCDRPASETLIETGKVRVYTLSEAGVFGCLKATGRSTPLKLPEEEGTMALEVDPDSIAVSAPLVAYAVTQFYFDSHGTQIGVRNLRTGSIVRACPAGGGLAPQTFPRVIRIVLSPRGAVAWSAEESATGPSRDAILACGSPEPQTLDAGDRVDLESLALQNGTVSWLDAGTRRTAYLE